MAKRQEQETASSTITEVGPGIIRMQLPIHMPGLGHVNMYALLDSNGAAVIDPGLPGRFTWRAIEDRLKQADLKPKDVHTVLITHSHPDHFGGARRFVEEHGAKVVAHESFRFGLAKSIIERQPEVSVNDLEAHADATQPDHEAAEHTHTDHAGHHNGHDHDGHDHDGHDHGDGGWWGGPSPWGGQQPRPPLNRRLLWSVMRMLGGRMSVPEISHPVAEGDWLTLAGRQMRVLHTPGHTPDHFCLHDPEAEIFIAGDHVLPTITPHISGISSSADPLLAFFASLDAAGAIPNVSQVLPAHGHPFADLAERTEAIKAHHVERLEKIQEISRMFGRPANVTEFTRHLFRKRSWGSMAESETYAHLEHLRLAGDAESTRDRQGMLLYTTG
ncbi:MAG: MBL fold metallo-hydrolase [Proteobacteria bacterium]|nr:MBL fold metallo-hydrolase [Pseudomonadota bacterium]